MNSSSVNKEEIEKFSKDSSQWWNEDGPFSPLHKLNPARITYIKQQICSHYERDYSSHKALEGLSILDIGCGGGLVCEPMARMGANVTGIDADSQAIKIAQEHAEHSNLKIFYKNEPAENLREKFDVVLALEIIEHVHNPETFIKTCAKLLKPNGLIIFSTLNKTIKSMALGVFAAEYILRWVPKGTHQWKKFIRPSSLARMARTANIVPNNFSGLVYNPISGFKISRSDMDVNYFMSGIKE